MSTLDCTIGIQTFKKYFYLSWDNVAVFQALIVVNPYIAHSRDNVK